jgi:OOP family OmpA-OmpF porin
MDSIIEVARAALRGDAVERMSTWIGESPLAVQQGVDAAVPLSVVGIARHASTEGRAKVLLDGIEDGTYPYVEPGELDPLLDNPPAADKLARSSEGVFPLIFGSKRDGIIDALTAHSGVSRAAASKLLGLVSALALGIVHHQIRSHNLDARGLARYLGEQERTAFNLLPASLVGLLGAAPPVGSDASSRVTERYSGPLRAPEPDGSRRAGAQQPSALKWLPWLLAAVAAIALFSFSLNRKPRRFEPMSRPVTDEAARPAEPEAPVIAAPPLDILSPAAGTGALSRYLTATEPTPRRFLVEGIEFNVGSSSLPSTRTLDEVAALLKAYPTARIRVEGHTDAVGTPSTNESLTQAQAEAVKGYLVQRGVAADRIDAAGLGERQPRASNDTPEGRDRNRRIEIVVLQR